MQQFLNWFLSQYSTRFTFSNAKAIRKLKEHNLVIIDLSITHGLLAICRTPYFWICLKWSKQFLFINGEVNTYIEYFTFKNRQTFVKLVHIWIWKGNEKVNYLREYFANFLRKYSVFIPIRSIKDESSRSIKIIFKNFCWFV